MTAIAKVIEHLEKLASPNLQEDYDNSGLILGHAGEDIKGVMVSLDCTEEVMDEALKNDCNLLITHHPLLFKAIKRLTGKTYVERCLIKAIKNDLAIYAIHTNLDSVPHGVSGTMAEKLGLLNTMILRPGRSPLKKLVTFCPVEQADEVRKAIFKAGAGHIGNYDHCSFNAEGRGTFRAGEESNPYVGKKGEDHSEAEVRIESIFRVGDQAGLIRALLEAHPYEEVAYDIYPLDNVDTGTGFGLMGDLPEELGSRAFLSLLKSRFHTGVIRHSEYGGKIRKVAVCGGSGAFLIDDALAGNADAYVTGDIKYHDFFESSGNMMLADIGHFESEQFTVHLLVEELRKNFTTFATHFSSINTNPIKTF